MKVQTSKSSDCIDKISVQKLGESLKMIIVDVRTQQEYMQTHIPGAINIPLDSLADKTSELSNTDLIVTTCGKGGGRSAEATRILTSKGLNSRWLCGGTFGWL